MALACPCGSGEPYADCCRPLVRGQREATTASALMRSRYTAYVRGDRDYLSRTWHPSTRPSPLEVEPVQWRGLDVGDVTGGGEADREGTATFTAHWVDERGVPGTMRETSRFVREGGRWLYLDGTVS